MRIEEDDTLFATNSITFMVYSDYSNSIFLTAHAAIEMTELRQFNSAGVSDKFKQDSYLFSYFVGLNTQLEV